MTLFSRCPLQADGYGNNLILFYRNSGIIKDYKKVSVLIAAYNEENTISKIIDKIQNIKLPVNKEIIIVDDGSTDATREIIKNNILPNHENVLYFEHVKNIGKGAAIRTALRHATGDIILIQDAV